MFVPCQQSDFIGGHEWPASLGQAFADIIGGKTTEIVVACFDCLLAERLRKRFGQLKILHGEELRDFGLRQQRSRSMRAVYADEFGKLLNEHPDPHAQTWQRGQAFGESREPAHVRKLIENKQHLAALFRAGNGGDGFVDDQAERSTVRGDTVLRKGKIQRDIPVLEIGKGDIGEADGIGEISARLEDIERLHGSRTKISKLVGIAFDLCGEVDLKAQGKGSAQDNINLATFEKATFPFPPIDQQREVVSKLDNLWSSSSDLVTAYSNKIDDIDDLRQSLLQKAFAGELT